MERPKKLYKKLFGALQLRGLECSASANFKASEI